MATRSRTGTVIVDHFRVHDVDPVAVPGVLVAGHAPFTWGPTPDTAVDNAVALEAVAHMALLTAQVAEPTSLESHVLEVHHDRKHGATAYYGQRP